MESSKPCSVPLALFLPWGFSFFWSSSPPPRPPEWDCSGLWVDIQPPPYTCSTGTIKLKQSDKLYEKVRDDKRAMNTVSQSGQSGLQNSLVFLQLEIPYSVLPSLSPGCKVICSQFLEVFSTLLEVQTQESTAQRHREFLLLSS